MKTYILLDRSGSMHDQWDDTLGGINTYVKNLKGKQNVSLAVFDSWKVQNTCYQILRDCQRTKWKPLTNDEVSPRGGTPLNDALAETILRMLEDKEDRAVLVVMTDGYENSSVKFSHEAVKHLLERIRQKDYQVVFLGASFEDIKSQASSYGIDATFRGIVSRDIGSTYTILSNKVNAYAGAASTANKDELAATMDWSPAEQEKVRK